ncbi:hypothetical protein JCM10908_001698 [Rhodotorula pacifica]|uniref:uncharacterized protein n=1 Tax=Rhodotorula pacifica TaxID=1495444 RepID=UPI00317B0AD5
MTDTADTTLENGVTMTRRGGRSTRYTITSTCTCTITITSMNTGSSMGTGTDMAIGSTIHTMDTITNTERYALFSSR